MLSQPDDYYTALVMSRLDYCNGVLAGVLQSTLKPLQRVQNTAARLVHQLDVRDHVTPSLMVLHWLLVRCRIVQTVHDHVRNTHLQMPGVSQRHPYVQQHSNTYWPVTGFQQQVRDATAANQVWRIHLLTCRTSCMELTAARHSCCSQPCHVQETTQNALFNIAFFTC